MPQQPVLLVEGSQLEEDEAWTSATADAELAASEENSLWLEVVSS